MAKAKKKTQQKSRHERFEEARKEVEGAVRKGPIVRLVQIPTVGELHERDKEYWLMRLGVEQSILRDRHDKQAGRKPPAELARQKCARLMQENKADQVKVLSNGNLWAALVHAEDQAREALARVARLESVIAGTFQAIGATVHVGNCAERDCPECQSVVEMLRGAKND